VATTFGRTDKAISGRTGIIFKPVTQGSIYAAYSTSFTPSFDGTLGLTLAATGVNSQGLAPEKTHNIEVGTKWDLTPSLQFTAAAFDIEKTNAKTTDLTGATVLAGDQDVKGVEFGLSGNLTARWAAFGGLSLMNGTVKNSGIPSEIGAVLPYVPKSSFNLWSTYRLPIGLTLGGGTNYNSGNYFNQTGGFSFVAGGTVPNPKYVENAAAVQALTKYWLFNAVAIYPLNSHIQLQLNATNLGNEKYADRAYDRHFLPGPARQVVFAPVITF
jgi:catecholate siderophore receptor